MNFVAFSVYGSADKYLVGAIRNAQYIAQSMTDWVPIFFVDTTVPQSVVQELQANGALVRIRADDWHPNGMFWRFQAFFEENANRVLIRDADSRISQRELFAIRLWIVSGKDAHIIRDHPLHQSLVMGGMWGARAGLLESNWIWRSAKHYGVQKGADQEFLNRHIYPILKSKALIHDSFFCLESGSVKIPLTRHDGEFIGEVIDEFEMPDLESRRYLIKIDSSVLRRNLLVCVVLLRFTFQRFKAFFRIRVAH